MILPWEQPEIKRIIEVFGCKVMSIEPIGKEVGQSGRLANNPTEG